MPNVAAYQQAVCGNARLGRMSAAPYTRNHQDWRRDGRSAALGQARGSLSRSDFRQANADAGHEARMSPAE